MRMGPKFLLLGLVSATACGEIAPTATLSIHEVDAVMGIAENGGSHGTAQLAGENEIPVRETLARGTAIFQLSDDGSTLSYRLVVANIDNVVASHIHLGTADENGPVVAFLFGPAAPGGGGVSGVLATGEITAANLVGPLVGQTLDDLMAQIVAGGAYVNVHTNDGVGAANSGAGDFAAGEVRGQIH